MTESRAVLLRDLAETRQELQQAQARIAALERQLQRLKIFHKIDVGLRAGDSAQALIDITLQELRQLVPCQRASVLLLNPTKDCGYIFALEVNNPTVLQPGVTVPIPADWFTHFDANHVQVIHDLRTLQNGHPPDEQLIKEGIVSVLRVLLVVQSEPIGMLSLSATTPSFFTAADQELVTEVAGQLAVVLHQMQLANKLAQRTASLVAKNDELQRTEATLRYQEKLFRSTFEQAAVGIAHVAPNGQWLRVNQRLCEILGYSAAELLQHTFQDLTHPDHLAADRRSAEQLLAGEIQSYNKQKRYLHKSGRAIWVNLTVSLVRDDAGLPDYLVSVIEDVTLQKNLELEQQRQSQAMEEMQQFLQAIFDASAANKAVLDRDGTIIHVNAAWRHFAGRNGAHSPTHYCGDNYLRVCDQATGLFSAEAAHVAAGIRAVIAGQLEQFQIEYPCNSLTEERWFSLNVTPFAETAPRRVVVAHHDITPRIQIERAERAQRRLAEALRDSLAALTSSRNVEQVMQQILEQAATVVPSTASSIILVENGQGRVAYLRGFTPAAVAFFQSYRFSMAECRSAGGTVNHSAYLVPETEICPAWTPLPVTSWIRSSVGVPIELHGQLIGWLTLDSQFPHHFGEADIEKLQTFARYASLALETADHVSRLEQRVTERTTDLQKAKDEVEAILNNSLDGIVMVRRDLSVQRTNASFDRLFTLPCTNSSGCSLLDLIPDAETVRVSALLQAALEEQSGRHFETRACRKDGSVFDAEFSIGPSGANALVCTIRDITERKQAQLALAEERNLLRTLIDTLPDAIYLKDVHHRTIISNLTRARWLGLQTAEETVGKDDFDFFTPELAATFHAVEDQIFQTGQPLLNQETAVVIPTGKTVWITTNKVPLYNLDNKLVGLVGMSRDISAQKESERQLRYFASLQESVSEAVIVTDMNFYIQSWNAAAVHIYGWQAAEAVGHPVTEVLQPAYPLAEEGELRVQKLLTAGQWHGEALHRHKSGRPLHILTSLTLLKDEQGKPYGIVSINRDITADKQIENTLEETRRLAQRIAEIAPNIIYIHDVPSGRNTYINRSILTLLGYADQGLTGPDAPLLTSLMHPTDAAQLAAHIAQVTAGREGEIFTYEYRLRAKDNHWRWFLSYETIFQRDAAGVVTQILGTAIEITGRKRIEADLQKSAAELHDLYNNAPCAYHSLNEAGVIVQINDTELRWLGYSRAEVVGIVNFYDLLLPASQESFQANFARFKAVGWAKDLEVDVLRKDGTIMTILLSASAIYDEAGHFVMSRSTFYDITELKQAQEAIRTSEARYRLLAENISDLIMRTNAAGEFVYVSPSSQTLLGYAPQELLGRSGFDFVHPDDLAALVQLYSQILTEPLRTAFATWRFRHTQGHYLWMEFAARIVRTESTGAVQEIIVSARDISARKRAEETLQAQIEAEQKFQNALKALHEITMELTQIDELDDFYRRAVELGVERLGFERLGLLLYDAEHDLALGTYGTNVQGQVVAEPHIRLTPADYGGILQRTLTSSDRFCFDEETLLFSNYQPIGVGWNAMAVLWDGQQSLGWLGADNGVEHKPVSKQLLEILPLYSLTLGTLLARKRLETALRDSEEKFRRLVEVAPVAIVISDQTGQITLANQQALAIFGYTRAELLAQSVDVLVPVYARGHHMRHRATYVATPRVRRMGNELELLAKCKDGREFPVEIELSYVQIHDGLMVMSFIVDITERKQAEVALREQRDFLQRVIDSLPDLIVVKDSGGRFQLVSERTAQVYGLTASAMLGQTDADIHPNLAAVALFKQQDQTALDSGQPVFVPEEVINDRYYQTNVIPLPGQTGKFERLLVVSSDITARKQAEDTLQQALQQEKELGDLKSRFISMASHEFRTPLATMLALTETLRAYRHRLPAEQIDQRLDKIQVQIGYLKSVMEDVLQLARLQVHQAEFNPTLIDLDDLARSVIDEFQSRPDVTQTLVYHCDHALRSVQADSKLLRRIISNLVSNAVKYSPEGTTITVTLTYTEETLTLTVCDQGIGIPEADLKHLFEPFHRATNVGTIAGTGLGLSITKQSVELHGGAITVESQLNVGSTFTVCIPLAV